MMLSANSASKNSLFKHTYSFQKEAIICLSFEHTHSIFLNRKKTFTFFIISHRHKKILRRKKKFLALFEIEKKGS